LNLVLGIVLAGFLCVGSVISAELLDDKVHSARQLEAISGGPVLATVPENRRKMLSQRTPSSRQMKVNRVRAELSA
jgi:capsular polysaccharide biosynthesis protein